MSRKGSHLTVKCLFTGISLDWLFPCSFKTFFRLTQSLVTTTTTTTMQRCRLIWLPVPWSYQIIRLQFGALSTTSYLLFICSFIIYILRLEQRLYKSRYLVCLVHCCRSNHLEQCLTYSRHSVNVYWMNWRISLHMNKYIENYKISSVFPRFLHITQSTVLYDYLFMCYCSIYSGLEAESNQEF